MSAPTPRDVFASASKDELAHALLTAAKNYATTLPTPSHVKLIRVEHIHYIAVPINIAHWSNEEECEDE
jgi:hypothetical protein